MILLCVTTLPSTIAFSSDAKARVARHSTCRCTIKISSICYLSKFHHEHYTLIPCIRRCTFAEDTAHQPSACFAKNLVIFPPKIFNYFNVHKSGMKPYVILNGRSCTLNAPIAYLDVSANFFASICSEWQLLRFRLASAAC